MKITLTPDMERMLTEQARKLPRAETLENLV